MKTLNLQRKLASKILGCGTNKIWFDSDRLEDIREAITAEDIRELIKDGAIKGKITKGVKARAAKFRAGRRRKKRKRGLGKKKKILGRRKSDYVKSIRKLRGHINLLRERGLDSKKANKLRKLAKSGHLTTIKNMEEYLKQNVKTG